MMGSVQLFVAVGARGGDGRGMLSKIIVHVCARCGSECIRKNGHAINGAQRAKCLDCKRTFILEPAGPRYPQGFKDQVLCAY